MPTPYHFLRDKNAFLQKKKKEKKRKEIRMHLFLLLKFISSKALWLIDNKAHYTGDASYHEVLSFNHEDIMAH